MPEHLAGRRRPRRQRPGGGMPVELAPAGDGPLAADVEGAERVDLACIRDAGDHAELLMHGRVGPRRLHAAELQRRPRILVEVRQDGRGRQRLRGKLQRAAAAAYGAGNGGDRGAIGGDQHAGDAVIGADPRQVVPHHGDAGRAPFADRLVHLVDGGFLDLERGNRGVHRGLLCQAGFQAGSAARLAIPALTRNGPPSSTANRRCLSRAGAPAGPRPAACASAPARPLPWRSRRRKK